MKKFVLIVPALMALAAVSCTKSEVLETNSGEIRFNVVANKVTKAADVFCNNNMPGAFKVYAVNEGKTYIEGDDIVKTGENSWENQSGVRYWPETAVDFYAHVNAGNAFIWSESSAPTVENFTPSTTVSDQVDLLCGTQFPSCPFSDCIQCEEHQCEPLCRDCRCEGSECRWHQHFHLS